MFAIDWTDPALYAIVLNTARIPVPDCVDYLIRVLQSPAYRETEQSRMILVDELVLRRVNSALEQQFGGDEEPVIGYFDTLVGTHDPAAAID